VYVVIELFSLAVTVEVLQGKMCQKSLLSGGGGPVLAKISGEGSSLGNIFGLQKTRHILLFAILQTAPCYVPSF